MNRRELLEAIGGVALGAAAASLPVTSLAQSGSPITLVVPYAPGGTSDMLGRLIAQHLGGVIDGRQVIVDNRPGAGTSVGASHVARSAPDGGTLLLATSTTLAINPSLYPKLSYDPKELAPVGLVAAVPFMLVVNPSLNVRSVEEFVAVARERPGGLNYGSAGNGSPQHLIAEMFKAATGVPMRHVPYKGTAPALADLLGGQIDAVFADVAPALPHVKAGKLVALGVATASRLDALPHVPTIAEAPVQGTQDFEAAAWQGIVVPAATSRDVVARLHGELTRVLSTPEVRAQLRALNVEPRSSESPEQFVAYVRSEAARWSKVIEASGARVD